MNRRWAQIDRIFDHALDLKPKNRGGYLKRACGGDVKLQLEVERLLEADDRAESILGDPSMLTFESEPSLAGTRVGPFEIRESIGRGGMGHVFLADRVDGEFDQQVAIKFLSLGASQKARDRFRFECQALARLSHPNIVTLIDGGLRDTGVGYLAMELVDGCPILEYANRHSLNYQSRLLLFLQLCDAVTYAHQHLIVHRDLKPNNVLVSVDGRVKLLDFGISKDLSSDATETAPLMTPRYAAPEQILGQPVTTATDVYALGLILYELLAGRPAFEGEDQSMESLVRRARKPQPKSPSVASGKRRLRGGPDAVLLKCLQADSAHRYASVAALADDLNRLIRLEPPMAGNRGPVTRGWSFVRRNALGSAVASAVFLGALTAGYWHLSRVETERDQANAALGFLSRLITEFNPRTRSQENSLQISAADFFRRGFENLSTDQHLSPSARASIAQLLSTGMENTGDQEGALAAAELAVNSTEDGSDEHYWARLRRAAALINNNQRDKADSDYEFLASAVGKTIDPNSLLAGTLWNDIGFADSRMDTSAALEALTRAIDVLARHSDPEGVQAYSTGLDNLARVEETLGMNQQAFDHRQRAIDIRQERFGPNHLELAHLYGNQANLAGKVNGLAAGGELHKKAIEIAERVLDENHSTALVMRNNYSLWLHVSGDLSGASAELQRLIDIRSRDPNTNALDLAGNYQNLATVFRAQGNLDAADAAAAKCSELYNDHLAPESYRHALPWLTRAEIALAKGEPDIALRYANKAYSRLSALPADHPIVTAARLLAAAGQGRSGNCVELSILPTAGQLTGLKEFLNQSHPLQEVADSAGEIAACR